MPAQNLLKINADGTYCHIYNRGIEKKTIFNDEQDYKVFLGYLNDYLTPYQDPEVTKKVFSIKGRIFRGIPHQPKNYFNKVELIAYSLMPNHFHLLVHETTKNSLEGFIRSLCTRYSIYFNKKYQRTGSLFQGPYKSVLIKDETCLLHLTRYLHIGGYSSYAEYLGARKTLWVKPEVVLSFLGKGTSGYKDFVEKYEPDQKEKELLEKIILESENQHLERRDPANDIGNNPPKIPSSPDLKPLSRMPELLAIVAVFLLLVGLGVRNILASTTKTISPKPSPTPLVLPKTVDVETEAEAKPKTMLTIKITDGSKSINIRKLPTVNSNKIGEAKEADTFEFVSVDSGWYEIKLADGSTGFISARYIEAVGEINN